MSNDFVDNYTALFPNSMPKWSNKTITYNFLQLLPNEYSQFKNTKGEIKNFQPMDNQQQNATINALNVWSDVANITFQSQVLGADLSFGTNDRGNLSSGYAYYPGLKFYNGDVWINNNYTQGGSNNTPAKIGIKGFYGFSTLVHEIGHALGLEHPGNYNASGGGTDASYLVAEKDSIKYTVMSYNNSIYGGIYPETPMLFDIAAVQTLYGANMETRKANDNYSWNKKFVATIWDAGGNDTINASNQKQNVMMNLNAGSFSSLSGLQENLAIAFGVTIENAIGSAYNDLIVGNDAANSLKGGAGNDLLRGGTQADTLDGGADIDTASYFTSATGVSVSLTKGNGWFGDAKGDLLISIENLKGSKYQDLLIGNEVNNVISGLAGNDRIYGKAGNDTLYGGGKGYSYSAQDNDYLYGGDGNDLIYAQDGEDLLNGETGDDRLFGGAGNDQLYGGTGKDRLDGGTGNDLLKGGQGNDQLYGQLGDDRLYGGDGDDSLYGGDGRDTFELSLAAGKDFIFDFVKGQDFIQLLDGLTFGDLQIFQGKGADATDTFIQAQSGNDVLAVLDEVLASTINRFDFITSA